MMYAKYTVVLKSLLENPETKGLIDKALSNYPLYEQRYVDREYIPNFIPTRSELNQKILNHYKYREIGFETVGRFIDELEIAMNEIMPKYNQVLYTMDLDFNPIYNVDYIREHELEKDGTTKNKVVGENQTSSESSGSETSKNTSSATDTGNTTNSSTDTAKTVHADTPQDSLSITGKNIDSVSYADSVQWNKHDTQSQTDVLGTTSGETNINSNTTGSESVTGSNSIDEDGTTSETEKFLEKIKGNYGQISAQSLIKRFRDNILNVEKMIINDERIKELFMLVY